MPPIIDLHCDTLYRISSAPERFFASPDTADTHVFHSGLRVADGLVQCFALFTDLCELPAVSPLSPLRQQVACFQKILSSANGQLLQIKTASHLAECLRENKTGAILTLEEGCLSEHPVSLLPEFFDLGVRMTTFTWDYSTLLASSATNALPIPLPGYHSFSPALAGTSNKFSGLTPTGFDFLSEAEHLGILIDVSHLSDAGFRDVASHSKRPFLASHSNARSVYNVPRNLSDDMLRTLALRGGLTGLCLHEPFLLPAPHSPKEVTEALVAHVKHILSVAGSETIALGTDFDGTPTNTAIPNITRLPHFAEQLKKAGLTSGQIDNLFYKNALRFFLENLPE